MGARKRAGLAIWGIVGEFPGAVNLRFWEFGLRQNVLFPPTLRKEREAIGRSGQFLWQER
jgi:hypothetical protein